MIDPKYITTSRDPFFELANKYIQRRDKILDIGCGNGTFASFIGRNDVFMMDLFLDRLTVIKNEYENLVCAKAPNLPFKKESFNIIHSSHLIEHLQPHELYSFLKNCDYCLKKEGFLIISAPVLWKGFHDDMSHVRPYNHAVLTRYLSPTSNLDETTRSCIGSYETKEIVFRYCYESDQFQAEKFTGKFLLKAFHFLCRLAGIKKVKQNGFTIVFKKT